MHQELNYNTSFISTNLKNKNLSKLDLESKKILILGGSSGFGKSIYNYLTQKNISVFSAGRSKNNHLEIDMKKKSFVKRLTKFCLKKNINTLIVTAANHFLDFNNPDIFNKKYQRNLYMNSFYLYDLVTQLNSYKSNVNSIILFTAEGGWSGSPISHINYNLSKTLLNSIIFHISQSRLVNCICGIDPGEAKTKMNKSSTESPDKCIPMILRLIENMSNYPENINGTFFHVDGRHLSFLKKPPCTKTLDL